MSFTFHQNPVELFKDLYSVGVVMGSMPAAGCSVCGGLGRRHLKCLVLSNIWHFHVHIWMTSSSFLLSGLYNGFTQPALSVGTLQSTYYIQDNRWNPLSADSLPSCSLLVYRIQFKEFYHYNVIGEKKKIS